ncbi:WD40 repeat-like protein [Nadsonia fulvescens var. elongata DSM 6958]|uniref:WD40 repeat-like protein n=1 Tax=Nadsonia fulvescens var. elongata DSM 6958 TaxID=857566 RepID=A0A1E3PS42_9ASCO|nr:WD40 repeat-like protein [Nadsonia fulvescens var. elongata DSM 6958]
MSLVKRVKTNGSLDGDSSALISAQSDATKVLIQSGDYHIPRTSGLKAPILQLSGHEGAVTSCSIDNSGQYIVSGSVDKSIQLWNVYGSQEFDERGNDMKPVNFGSIASGHKSAVLDVRWTRDSRSVVSASADLTAGLWDVETGERLRKFKGHSDMVNSVNLIRRGVELVLTTGDDGCIGVWDQREKRAVAWLETDFPVLAVDSDHSGSTLFTAGINPDILAWDIRQVRSSVSPSSLSTHGLRPLYTLPGHSDTTMSLDVSPDGNSLLSNSMDSSVRTWDIKPFSSNSNGRLLKIFDGAPAGIENLVLRARWSKDGKLIGVGGADNTVTIWNSFTGKLEYKLPGHKGVVLDVSFSPIEPVMVTSSSDKTLILGEIGRV